VQVKTALRAHLLSGARAGASASGGARGRRARDQHDRDHDERRTQRQRGQHKRQVGVDQQAARRRGAVVVVVRGRRTPVPVGGVRDRAVDDDDEVDVGGARWAAVVARRHPQRVLGAIHAGQVGRRRQNAARANNNDNNNDNLFYFTVLFFYDCLTLVLVWFE